jgi:hypothetical protein
VPLSDAIQDFLRQSGLGAKGRDGAVFRAWNEAYGSADARPVALRNGALHLEVTSSSLLQDLKSYSGDRFRRKANQILGEEKIRRIVVKLTSR